MDGPKTHCGNCTEHAAFTTEATLKDGTKFRYWCPVCDGHAAGCENKTHPFGRLCVLKG